MNLLSFLSSSVAAIAILAVQATAQCTSIDSITCTPVSSAPTLDGDISDWSSVEEFETPLTSALQSDAYPHGDLKVQCVYDDTKIYFLFQFPGPYRFDSTDDHLCSAVSTMFKMGAEASLYNMGNCPLAATSCTSSDCNDYKVDLGGHWELSTTKMGVLYGTNNGTGDDATANKDDEYSVSPSCRFDDDDATASNEWEGVWSHTSPTTEGNTTMDSGYYIYEMARLLTTDSTESDAQLVPGTAIDFGFAVWDPFEDNSTGWSDAGHYVTGCAKDWISLMLVTADGTVVKENSTGGDSPTSSNVTESENNQSATQPVSSSTTKSSLFAFISSIVLALSTII